MLGSYLAPVKGTGVRPPIPFRGATGRAAVTLAKHYGARVIGTASRGKHETVLALGADHVLDSRDDDIATEVLRLTGGAGADLVLESMGGATFNAGLAAAKRVTGRVVVYGVPGGEALISNWELLYKHQVHIIGLNVGVLIQAAPQIFGEVMGELFALIAAVEAGEVSWLEPLPDAWIAPPADDPAAVAIERESLRPALIAGLQHLPGRQRAILILREVLAFCAAETAEIPFGFPDALAG